MAKDRPLASAGDRAPPGWHNQLPEWYGDGLEHVWFPYTQMETAPLPLPVVSTNGSRIKLADGRELIDGIGSWWTACHGYNHPHITAAMKQQIDDMPHVMFGGLAHEQSFRLADRLATLLPGDLDHVFFADGGSVSVEIALKMALQYWINKGQPDKRRFLAFRNGYHGDTLGAMAVAGDGAGMHKAFEGSLGENILASVPRTAQELGELEGVFSDRGHEIAAVVIEPLVQGAGGMKMHEPEVLKSVVELAQSHSALVIADEIFTGFGRTGTMFACEQADVVPDIICLGKAMTGGAISLAATVARGHVYDAFLSNDPDKALMHGPTFMASPLACAAANASLDLFEQEPRLKQAGEIGVFLHDALAPCRDMKTVLDVRVKGAIAAVQVCELKHLEWLRSRFVEQGIWLRPFSDIIYLTPPLNIEMDDLRFLADKIVAVLEEWDRL